MDDKLTADILYRAYKQVQERHMPYYIYTVTGSGSTNTKSVALVREYENFKLAKTEVRRLRTEEPLEDNQIYKIIFADDQAEAEQRLREFREEPIAKEWEK